MLHQSKAQTRVAKDIFLLQYWLQFDLERRRPHYTTQFPVRWYLLQKHMCLLLEHTDTTYGCWRHKHLPHLHTLLSSGNDYFWPQNLVCQAQVTGGLAREACCSSLLQSHVRVEQHANDSWSTVRGPVAHLKSLPDDPQASDRYLQ